MLMDHEILATAEETQVPLLDPVHEIDLDNIPEEITELIEKGFKTLKVKVGSHVEDDLRRVRPIQKVVNETGVIIRLVPTGISVRNKRSVLAPLSTLVILCSSNNRPSPMRGKQMLQLPGHLACQLWWTNQSTA